MNTSKTFVTVILLFGLALVVANQIRLNQRLNAALTQHEQLSEGASDENVLTAAQSELQETLRRVEQARIDLAATELKLTNMLAQVNNLQRQLQGIARAVESSRPQSFQSLTIDPAANNELQNKLPARAWGPEQVIGPPDTREAGDISTAWASREPDGGLEWLQLGYQRAVDLAELRVRETYNPGAISKVTAVMPNGQEVAIWEGQEPAAEAPIDRVFAVPGNVRAQWVRVYLDTARVPGWNEIDAVELVGKDGSRQWAAQVSASSTYAERR